MERKGILPVPPIWPKQSAISCLYLPNKFFQLLDSLSSLQKDKPIHVLIGNEALFLSVLLLIQSWSQSEDQQDRITGPEGDIGLPETEIS